MMIHLNKITFEEGISEVKQKCTELGVVWVTNLIPTLGGDKNTYQNARGK